MLGLIIANEVTATMRLEYSHQMQDALKTHQMRTVADGTRAELPGYANDRLFSERQTGV